MTWTVATCRRPHVQRPRAPPAKSHATRTPGRVLYVHLYNLVFPSIYFPLLKPSHMLRALPTSVWSHQSVSQPARWVPNKPDRQIRPWRECQRIGCSACAPSSLHLFLFAEAPSSLLNHYFSIVNCQNIIVMRLNEALNLILKDINRRNKRNVGLVYFVASNVLLKYSPCIFCEFGNVW
jgi:hypothetical protein